MIKERGGACLGFNALQLFVKKIFEKKGKKRN